MGNRKHSRCLCGHAVALIAVVNEDVGPQVVSVLVVATHMYPVEVTNDASHWLFAGERIHGKRYV